MGHKGYMPLMNKMPPSKYAPDDSQTSMFLHLMKKAIIEVIGGRRKNDSLPLVIIRYSVPPPQKKMQFAPDEKNPGYDFDYIVFFKFHDLYRIFYLI